MHCARKTSDQDISSKRTPSGKGSVQTILPLGNGTAIKRTTARNFTPGDRSTGAQARHLIR
jgi:hypothetical protein